MPETATKEKTPSEVAAAASRVKRTLTPTAKPAPSMKKTPTSIESAESMADERPIKPEITVPKPELPPTSKRAILHPRPAIEDGTDADAWERAELSKIQKRYSIHMESALLNRKINYKQNQKSRPNKNYTCQVHGNNIIQDLQGFALIFHLQANTM